MRRPSRELGPWQMSPWIQPFFEDFEEFFNDFMEPFSPRAAWFPRVESYRKNGNVVVKADLPGVDPKDVHVTLENGCLTIRGERKESRETREGEVLGSEIYYGSFERSLAIPEGVKGEEIKAKYHDGVLEIIAPLEPSKLPKTVKVEVEKTA
ncbi:MAG: Hsp20/alpha crystallin family protein [Deltaproteobacteria bacterium]|nr:Hsp20/alpha crystallin family protein [Deltaproteobacteria bacterium]